MRLKNTKAAKVKGMRASNSTEGEKKRKRKRETIKKIKE